MRDPLIKSVNRVLRNDNCSGCGTCTLVSNRIIMQLDKAGFVRPHFIEGPSSSSGAKTEARLFRASCPGHFVQSPVDPDIKKDDFLGPIVSLWRGFATDATVRHRGSSGGVLTALAAQLIADGQLAAIVGAVGSEADPQRTSAITIRTRDDALSAAGSRYAPVAVAAELRDLEWRSGDIGLVGKPCEASSVRALTSEQSNRPFLLSFFCAGVPSQLASDKLVSQLSDEQFGFVSNLRYRGDGWPGKFVIASSSGQSRSMSYEESWGKVLGRNLQWRCKVCPDGLGESADVTVGDLWESGGDGFPDFDDRPGQSVVIARTGRGDALLRRAVELGTLTLIPIESVDLPKGQPLQFQRKRLLLGRLVGSLVDGRRVPKFEGFRVVRLARKDVVGNARAAAGTAYRSRKSRMARRPN